MKHWLAVWYNYILKQPLADLSSYVTGDSISRLEASWDEPVHTAATFPFQNCLFHCLTLILDVNLEWTDQISPTETSFPSKISLLNIHVHRNRIKMKCLFGETSNMCEYYLETNGVGDTKDAVRGQMLHVRSAVCLNFPPTPSSFNSNVNLFWQMLLVGDRRPSATQMSRLEGKWQTAQPWWALIGPLVDFGEALTSQVWRRRVWHRYVAGRVNQLTLSWDHHRVYPHDTDIHFYTLKESD